MGRWNETMVLSVRILLSCFDIRQTQEWVLDTPILTTEHISSGCNEMIWKTNDVLVWGNGGKPIVYEGPMKTLSNEALYYCQTVSLLQVGTENIALSPDNSSVTWGVMTYEFEFSIFLLVWFGLFCATCLWMRLHTILSLDIHPFYDILWG